MQEGDRRLRKEVDTVDTGGYFSVVLAKEAMGVVVRERENDFRLLEEMVEHSLFAPASFIFIS